MSGETAKDVSGWTPDLLKSYVDANFATTNDAVDKEELAKALTGLRQVVETRLGGMDRATDLLAENVARVPTDVDRQVGHLKALHDERFDSAAKVSNERLQAIQTMMADRDGSIITRFQERDTRSEREARDNKIAVDAAFAAAKEAVAENNKSSALANDKSEATFTKQIDGIQLLISTTNRALSEKIDDLKARLDRGEGRSVQEDRGSDTKQWTIGIAIVVAVALIQVVLHFLPVK